MLKEKSTNSIASDAIILTIVRCITLVTSFIQTMILARILSIKEYGVFSQGLLIISIATVFTSLGLSNAVNYFYNKEACQEKRIKYINMIHLLTIISGIIGAIIIWISREIISSFYKSEMILPIIVFIIFRPMTANIIALYQPLYISLGKSKIIAIRNVVISILQIVLIPISFYFTKNIVHIFLVQLILDLMQILFFLNDLKKYKYDINLNIKKNEIKYITDILKYALPLALALMLGDLFKEADKLLIANFMTVEDLAVYTNMSRQLPFGFIALSFTAVVTPYIIRFLNSNRKKAIELWSNYIEFGYMTTWILCGGAIICARELLTFLYSEAYISGLNVFIIYLITEMFKFTYFGMILSATGKTKLILVSSTFALILNIILNIILFYILGFIGPAVSCLVSTIIIGIVQLLYSCKSIDTPLKEVLDFKRVLKFVIQLLFIGITTIILKSFIIRVTDNYMLILFFTYTTFIGLSLFASKKRLKYLMINMKG